MDATPVGNLEERIRKQSTEYEYAATFVAPEAHILVVDDNTVNLKVFVSLLKQTRVNVDVADSGMACLKLIAEKHYDLIFLDHMMPEMDGIEVLHRMKAMENHKNMETPIVALTANAITGAKEMYLREGFDAFLSKPINPEKLEQTILHLLPKELQQFEVQSENRETDGENVAADRNSYGMVSGNADTSVQDSEELPMIDGIDWNYGLMHLSTKELLLETVEDFYKAIPVEAKSLEQFYTAQNLQQYRIKVHGMKSSANMIGAIVLGGMAKVLENAAKDADIETIEKLHPVFIREWMSYEEKLEECIQKRQAVSEEVNEIEDYTVILAYLEMLRQALDELDIDEMDRIMELLEDFNYPKEIQEGINALSALVVNMDSEQAFIEIDELTNLIKNNEEWRSEE